MARHRQRDQEAGGEGLGVVETRKRLWEDIDGSVVQNRPSISIPGESRRKRRRGDPQKHVATETSCPNANVTTRCAREPITIDATNDGSLNESLVATHVYTGNAFDCFDEWGLVSPPSSVDAFDFAHCSELEELLAQVEGE